jgi:hypothetical protein
VNEDGRGGYDMNRNYPYDWQPNYIQYGACDYPLSQPETRAVVDFVLAHPNIAAAQCYHNAGGMILRGPGHEGGEMKPADARLLETIGRQGERILPYYHLMVSWRDLYPTWGDEDTWLYAARGILAYTNELWTPNNLYKEGVSPSDEQEAEFLKHVLLGEGVVPWRPFDHPTYGRIEIGGHKKEWGRVPPSFLLEEELHRNMAFTLYHAGAMPRLQISDVNVEPLGGELFKVWVTVENQRMMPTRTAQDVDRRINPPDIEARPERVELATIGGLDAERVQFIVTGHGGFTVTVDSAKGGLLRKEASLP